MGRMATGSEIANAAIFLTSEMASYITGHNLLVDGGYSSL
jgi:glucose 1-dehydrogenase/3-oxoacyl-[acyl-carrier protein] reductase